MKLLLAAILTFGMNIGFAHEGGHGEVEESGKFGGVTAPIVDLKEAGKGNKAKFLYKAELVRTASGKISLYIFDSKMNLVDLSRFAKEVDANLEVKKKGKFTYVGNFKLTAHGNHFMGQMPKAKYKPFNIDLYLKEGEQKLFVGFSNLD